MALDLNKIRIACGPTQLNGPDNLRDEIVNFIDDADSTLDVAVQEIDDRAIAEAFVRADQRGVKVRVILEQHYLRGRNNEVNRVLHSEMLREDISIHVDFNPEIFHQKFIIKDKNEILSGSTNFTTTGVEKNFNHTIIVKSSNVAKQYQMQFDEMMRGRFGKESQYDLEAPKDYDVGNVPVSAIFSPDHAPEMVIMKEMLKATNSIKFAIFTFAQSSGIDDTIRVLARNGVLVKGVFDRGQGNQRWAASHGMIGVDNIDVCMAGQFNHASIGKVHHKLMVLDDNVVIAGSFNYTGPANYINDENVLQIGSFTQPDNFDDAEWADALGKQAQIASYLSNEIDRIITEFGTPFV